MTTEPKAVDFEADEDDDSETVSVVLISKEDDETVALPAGQAGGTDTHDLWQGSGTIEPEIDPDGLRFYVKNSASLRSNIDAMAQNVHGYGWQPEPVIDFDAEDLREQIEVALYMEKYTAWEDAGGKEGDEPEYPSTEEISAAEKEWRRRTRFEKARLDLHFKNCCLETSFDDLRKRAAGFDRETYGKGAWEVIRARGMEGPPRRYTHVDTRTIRYQQKSAVVETKVWQWTSPTTYRQIKASMRFHLLLQITDGMTPRRYFREYGDPRIISSLTGREYKTVDALKLEEGPSAQPANELLVFSIYFPSTKEGVPRWHGVGPEVRGQYLVANLNTDYLANNAMPRSMLLVNDGNVGKKSELMLRKFFSTVKGKAHNRMAIIQAQKPRERTSFGGGGPVKMEFIDLSKTQREDLMFDKYDRRVDEKVGQQFRIPKQFRGDTSEVNRATSEIALRSTEDQVFVPERKSFDWIMNHKILPELGIKFWRFRSRGPTRHDPETLIKIIEILGKLGVMVPAEFRQIAERLLDVDLLRVAGEWQQLPLPLTIQGFKPPDQRPALSEAAPEQTSEPEDEEADTEGADLEPPPGQEPPQQGVLKEAVDELADLLAKVDDPEVLKAYREALNRDRDVLDFLEPPTDE